MNPKLNSLIKAIVFYVKRRDGFITKTKLLKLLYLFDVEYFRVHRQTFTGFEWKFYHLGPWTAQYDPILDCLVESDQLVRRQSSQPDYDTQFFEPAQEEAINVALPELKDEYILKVILDNWGDKSSGEILDYVYFETEPMIKGQRDRLLDFGLIPEEPTPSYRRSPSGKSDKEIQAVRNRVAERLKSNASDEYEKTTSAPPRYDDEYWKAVEIMEELSH
jgi:hypothetical protein